MSVIIKGEPTTIEAYMIDNMKICQPNHIKITGITFNCETIEDANGTIFHKERKGRWIMHIDNLFPAESTMECDQCHEHQPVTIDDNFCPNCGAEMRKESE